MPPGFGEPARKALGHARSAAVEFGHAEIGPEHLLLGLAQVKSCVASDVLRALGADPAEVVWRVGCYLKQIPRNMAGALPGALPFTPRARRVLEYAMVEAQAFAGKDVEAEHLLLGLLVERESKAAQVLADLGLSLEGAREETVCQLRLRPEDVGPVTEASTQIEAERSEHLETLLRSNTSPHLPPLSGTGRKVQRILSWGTPILILIGGAFLVFFENHPANPTGSTPIFFGLLFVPLFSWILFVALFRLQAHILELVVILPVCSLPMGAALNMDQSEEAIRWLIGTIGVLLLAGGSVWALSITQRSGEKRTWPRMGLIVLGWAMCLGIVAFPLVLVSLLSRAPVLSSAWEYLLAAPCMAAAVAGLLVESRCQKRYGSMRVL